MKLLGLALCFCILAFGPSVYSQYPSSYYPYAAEPQHFWPHGYGYPYGHMGYGHYAGTVPYGYYGYPYGYGGMGYGAPFHQGYDFGYYRSPTYRTIRSPVMRYPLRKPLQLGYRSSAYWNPAQYRSSRLIKRDNRILYPGAEFRSLAQIQQLAGLASSAMDKAGSSSNAGVGGNQPNSNTGYAGYGYGGYNNGGYYWQPPYYWPYGYYGHPYSHMMYDAPYYGYGTPGYYGHPYPHMSYDATFRHAGLVPPGYYGHPYSYTLYDTPFYGDKLVRRDASPRYDGDSLIERDARIPKDGESLLKREASISNEDNSAIKRDASIQNDGE